MREVKFRANSARCLDAVALLRSMEGETAPLLGRRVVVYGGGNTAIDVARSARRLGATQALIGNRRTREKMPAHDFELEEALQEGVMVKWLSTIRRADEGALTIEKMHLNEQGQPEPTGEFETLERVSGLVVADGVGQVDPATMMTGRPGVFAGGDRVPAERNVTVAVGHGKKAAPHIDAWLRAARLEPAPAPAPAGFERLNPWYYSDAPQALRPQLDLARRTSSFDEVQGGLTEANALFEARRCLSCGNCFECENCYGVCPDSSAPAWATSSTTTTARAAASARPNARAQPSRCNRKMSDRGRGRRHLLGRANR